MLTGKVPFPGGTLIEKLFRHQTEKPRPVEQLRPEVSPAVGAIVRKLLAKRPDERFQTPSELAAALVGLTIPAHLQQAAAMTMVGQGRITSAPDYPVPTAVPVVAAAALNGQVATNWPQPKSAPPAPIRSKKKGWRPSFWGLVGFGGRGHAAAQPRPTSLLPW